MMQLTFFFFYPRQRCPSERRSHVAASVCLFFTGSAIRQLTDGEWGPCIGAAHSVALVTSRAETCVFVSVLSLTSFVLRDDFPGSGRIREKEKMLGLFNSLAGSPSTYTRPTCPHPDQQTPNNTPRLLTQPASKWIFSTQDNRTWFKVTAEYFAKYTALIFCFSSKSNLIEVVSQWGKLTRQRSPSYRPSRYSTCHKNHRGIQYH